MSKAHGKERFCWVCGVSMGWIADRWYSKHDTCESRECAREARDAWEAEREEAHERINRDFDGGW